MKLLLDNTSSRGSEADASPPTYGGDVFGRGIDPESTPDADDAGALQNQAGLQNQVGTTQLTPEQQKEKRRLIEEAKQIMNKSKGGLGNLGAQKVGEALGNKAMFADSSEKGRNEAKDFAKQKTRDFAKEQIGKKITNEGIKKGFEKGLEKGAGKALKEGGKKAATKAVSKGVAKGAAQVGTKAGAKVGSMAAVEGGIAAAGAASGFATFGLGFILSLFLDIAISLGINDAVDAAFELKDGNIKKAYFLAVRAAYKVMMFVVFLVTVILIFSVGGIIIAIPLLIILNLYMILGYIWKSNPATQGLVWWEKIILIAIDLIAFIIAVAFIGGMVYYLCETSGLGSGGVTGTVISGAAAVYDWWNGSNSASFAQELCKQVMAPAVQ